MAGNIVTTNRISATGNIVTSETMSAGFVTVGGNIDLTGTPGSFGFLRATSNITGANLAANTNITAGGAISAVGNITGQFFVGNGSLLTGIAASYGNSEVAAYLPTYTGNLVSLTGNVTTTANISGAFFLGNGSQLTGIVSSYGNANVAAYLPTYTGNLVSLTGNVTTTANISATNRVIASNYREGVFSFGNATGTITPDIANGSIQTMTLTGNITFNSITNTAAGSSATFILTQDGTGGRTLTSTMKFAGGSKTLSTAANAVDIISVFYDGTTYYASLTKGYA